MFIVFGTKELRKDLGVYQEEVQCLHCNNIINYDIRSSWEWFTLFWIPIFPISTKKYYSVCPICGYGYKYTKEEVENMLGIAQQENVQFNEEQVETTQTDSE